MRWKIWNMIMLVVIALLMIVACGGSDDDENEDNKGNKDYASLLIGTWECKGSGTFTDGSIWNWTDVISFYSNHTGSYYTDGPSVPGPEYGLWTKAYSFDWFLNGNYIYIETDEVSIDKTWIIRSLNQSNIILESYDMYFTGTRIK